MVCVPRAVAQDGVCLTVKALGDPRQNVRGNRGVMAMRHWIGDVQSVTHGHGSIGPGFVLYDSGGKPCVSFVYRHRQTAEDALAMMRECLIDAVAVEGLGR